MVFAIVLSAVSPRFVLGQTSIVIKADEQFRFAESYFLKREYHRAIGEYERFIHFFPQDPRVELAMYRVGLSYLKGERFRKAVQSFNNLIEKHHDTELAIKSYFRASECDVKLKQFGRALTTLDNLLKITQDQDVKDEVHYRRGWVHLETGAWEKGQASFDRISPKNRGAYRLKQLSEDINKKKS